MKKLFIFSLILSVFLVSCEDDSFLDRFPKDAISEENFFNSEEDLQLYVYGLVSMPGHSGLYVADQGTDNNSTTGSVEIKNIMTGTPSSENITSGWDWGRLRELNFFLENYQRADIAPEVKNHYAGIVRMYRAEFYYDKVKRYSDVPWYGKVLSPSDEGELMKPRDSRALVVDSIMNDLDFATASVYDDFVSGMPNRFAALHLKMRVALHEGTFRKYHPELDLQSTANTYLQVARDAAMEIINSGRYSLHSTGDPANDYAALFTNLDLSSNPEVILNNIYDAGKGRNTGGAGTLFDYEQSPAKSLVESYLMADGSRFTDMAGHENMTYVEEFQNRDPRLSQTLAYPGWISRGGATPYFKLSKNFSGYTQIKGYLTSTDDNVYNSVDVPVYRYAETLLAFAEAKAELGELSQADLDQSVNMLRARVGMPPLSMAAANANPDRVQMEKYPSVSGANAGVILEIRRERRVEMAMEGYRFDDLMRWFGGKLIEAKPMGMYFPGLGKYDMTGDGVEDIILIPANATIPDGPDKEVNSLGEPLVYYTAGTINQDVTVFLQNGENGGLIETQVLDRVFTEPRDYYRPVPMRETLLNPNLTQIFGWN